MNTAQLIVPGEDASATLRIAVAAYLGRFKGQFRVHTESDLRSFLTWCGRQGFDPSVAQRPHIDHRRSMSAVPESPPTPDARAEPPATRGDAHRGQEVLECQ
jgi:hypothetical protein